MSRHVTSDSCRVFSRCRRPKLLRHVSLHVTSDSCRVLSRCKRPTLLHVTCQSMSNLIPVVLSQARKQRQTWPIKKRLAKVPPTLLSRPPAKPWTTTLTPTITPTPALSRSLIAKAAGGRWTFTSRMTSTPSSSPTGEIAAVSMCDAPVSCMTYI